MSKRFKRNRNSNKDQKKNEKKEKYEDDINMDIFMGFIQKTIDEYILKYPVLFENKNIFKKINNIYGYWIMYSIFKLSKLEINITKIINKLNQNINITLKEINYDDLGAAIILFNYRYDNLVPIITHLYKSTDYHSKILNSENIEKFNNYFNLIITNYI
jgi:hypothetical protein